MDIRLALMTGVDIPIPECQLILHQPTIKEISFLGEQDFFTGVQCLCVRKEAIIQDESLLSRATNFQIFMTIMQEKQIADKKQAVLSVLNLLFPSYQIFLTPRSISFNRAEGNFIIDEGNFDMLQKVVSEIFCLSSSDQAAFNPANKKAKEIADKLAKARQKVAQLKAAENGGNSGSAFAQQISILTVGLGSMSLQDCMDLTVYQLQDLVERYQLFIGWDIDLRSRLAGAKPDKPVDNWMKQIH